MTEAQLSTQIPKTTSLQHVMTKNKLIIILMYHFIEPYVKSDYFALDKRLQCT